MKREIKFRLWDKTKLLMYSHNELNYSYALDPDIEKDKEDFELMQFTGLKDKNGKEIYEGDITKGTYEMDRDGTPVKSELRIIDFDNYGFRASSKSGETRNRLSEYFFFEVIGNVFENPELI